jgi:hypothetical protein
MKIFSIIGLIALSMLIGPVAAMADTKVINDSDNATAFWGGLVQGFTGSGTDIIGGNSFAVNTMVITNTGTSMTVQIHGPWFSSGSALNYSGDLYISSMGWNVLGSGGGSPGSAPNYALDTFSQAEGWDFVVAAPGIAHDQLYPSAYTGVYHLDYSNAAAFPNFMTFPTYDGNGGRWYQAYKGGYGGFVENATVTFDTHSGDNSSITFTFDTALLHLGNNPGFHWTMDCGNDVIEGQGTPVPEPATMLLLGFGLAGLCLHSKRAAQANSV